MESPADQPVGQRIRDRYEVVRPLGEGSFARTLLCRDLGADRNVAIKVLHLRHAESWKHLELFEREAHVLARLDHPGVPKIYEFFPGDAEDGGLYIVQQLVEGTSLKQRMDHGPMLGREDLFALTLGMLDVLEYIHGRVPPVLHRDIKPSNIILRPDGRPMLVDFGGVLFGWRPPAAGTTVVGTFGYMPPEQLVGQAGPTADLYALGATLLHAATGKAPAEFPLDTGRIEVPPDLPVQEALARLIERLLHPAPRDRPQSAEAARRILLGSASTALAVPSHAPAVATVPARRSVTVAAPNSPRFVDLGDSPRDPRGEMSDVYRNLIHPLFPARRLWGLPMHAFWLGISGFLAVTTVGIAPAFYLWSTWNRRSDYRSLFEHGAFTTGHIRAIEKGATMATFKYEFEVGGTSYVAFMDYAVEMARFWGEGDPVPVLYDPADPSRCCFVYR